MIYVKTLAFVAFFFASSLSYAGSYLNWNLSFIKIKVGANDVTIRSGYLQESRQKKFKGNILYYQGLADSMLNHDPLFEKLQNAGYRVIAFDYMGQGGSSGKMNNTTIENINNIGDIVLNKLKNQSTSKYNIIGWSTGGLAAYRKAFYDQGRKINSVILIAPGIAPNFIVGEGLSSFPIDEISIESLTSNRFENINNPHEDPISPRSPLYVPKFALNLQVTALKARLKWKINKKVKGFVLLSGENDTYVNSSQTKNTIRKNSKHFYLKTYENALHEIDNEKEKIASQARIDILNMLNFSNR